MAPEKPESIQRNFLARIGPGEPVRELFEHLPGVFFFAKDQNSRMMCASSTIYKRLGCNEELDVVGRQDSDFFPKQIADNFVRDDQKVFATGKPLLNRVEIWYNEQRMLDWFVTNKLPLKDESGNIIGLMGTVRSYEGSRKLLLPFSQISAAVEFIRTHHRERISVTDLAHHSGLSPRQLNRKFNDAFGMSAQDFLTKTRIQTASDALLNTALSIAEIAQKFGFCDQSAFTQAFRKHTGVTPLKFRKRYAP
ncbi:MAG: helix-turn-helix domain-containing protein [Verrucomicrobiota bacterium]|nr:helix-turn-helix domain-containing protein [Verrucomicrobiota bacterium]